MKKSLALFLIVGSILCPVRFGLAELTCLSEAPHVARRPELIDRQKSAPRIIILQNTRFGISTSPAKKHVRRMLHTKADPTDIPQPEAVKTHPEAGRAALTFEVFTSSLLFTSQYLRAPPAAL